MTFPQLQLVTDRTDDADVLYDFHDNQALAAPTDGGPRRNFRDLSFGAPETFGDDDAVNPAYGSRNPTWTQRLVGTHAQAQAAVSAIGRTLMAGPSWLRWRLAADMPPQWFEIYRADPRDLSFAMVSADGEPGGDIWDVPISLRAAPFASGAKETIAAQVVANDPTAATNPCRVVLPTIKGDAPSPLRIELEPLTQATSAQFLLLMHAAKTQRNAISLPVGTSDGFTSSATASAAADAIGGSMRTTTAALTQITRSVPSTPPGRYRVFVRADPQTGTTVALSAHDLSGGTPWASTSPVPVVADSWAWVDVGELTFPFGRPTLADQTATVTPDLSIQVDRLTGSGGVRIDHVLLIPVEAADTVDCRVVTPSAFSASPTATIVIDGDLGQMWVRTTSSGALQPNRPIVSGVFPNAVPGAVNTVHLLRTLNPSDGDNFANGFEVAFSYHPLYLWVAEPDL